MAPDGERIARLLGGEDLDWLVTRVRKRLERTEPLDGTVTLVNSTDTQRAAVQRLLGRRSRPGNALTVSLRAVDQVLRESGACPDGLAAAVVALRGPVVDRAAQAAAQERAWGRAFEPVEAIVESAERPALTTWLEGLRAGGLVRRLADTPDRAGTLLSDLAAVLQALPASGEPLGRFAARVAGSAHALDDDRPLATLALGAARALTGIGDGSGAEWRREVWASVGLLRDEVSSTVLTLGLPGDTRTATGRALLAWRAVGEPAVLTLRQLVRGPLRFDVVGQVVSVCENPVVVSLAADQLGAQCRPLVCTSGQPGAAAMRLLRALVAAGAQLRYHGDFDWGGVRIGNVIFERVPAQPWRFDTASYRAAATSCQGAELTGVPIAANWDPELAQAMRATGIRVEEEHTLDELLNDLAG